METVLQHLLALVLLGSFFFVIWYAKHKNKIPEKKEGDISDEGHNENVIDSVVGEAADEKTESNERFSTDSKQEQLEQVRQLYFASHHMNKNEFMHFANSYGYIFYNKPEENIPLLMESYLGLPFRQMLDARQKDKCSYFEMTLMMKYQDLPPKVLSEIAALAVQHYSIGFREFLQYLFLDMRRTKRSALKKCLRSLDDYGVAVDADEEKNT